MRRIAVKVFSVALALWLDLILDLIRDNYLNLDSGKKVALFGILGRRFKRLLH